MKKRNIIMAAAAAMAMAAGATSANALDIVLGGGGTKAVSTVSVAASLKGLASTANETGTITATGAAVLQVNDVVTITAVGAKFDRAALTASPVVFAGGTVATKPVVTTWTLDATDKILTGTVTTASSGLTAKTVVIDLTGKFDLTGVAAGTKPSFDMTVSRTVLGQNTVIHKKAANATTKQVFEVTSKIEDLATITAVNGTVKVADAFLKIGGALTHTIANGSVATAVKLDSNAAAATGTELFTLSGLPTAATKVAWGATTGAFSQVIADGKTAPTTSTTGSTFWLDGAGNGYALLSTAGAIVAFNDSAALVITVNGTASIPTTNVKLKVDYVAGTADKFVAHNILPATSVAALSRDGSSFSVNAAGPLNTIKVTDTSGGLTTASGKISVVAYDAAGALAAGTAPVLPTLTKNGTKTIAMSTLTTAYPTAVRFDFTVESTEIIASNVKKSSTGTTVTVYRNSVASGATTVGSGAI